MIRFKKARAVNIAHAFTYCDFAGSTVWTHQPKKTHLETDDPWFMRAENIQFELRNRAQQGKIHENEL